MRAFLVLLHHKGCHRESLLTLPLQGPSLLVILSRRRRISAPLRAGSSVAIYVAGYSMGFETQYLICSRLNWYCAPGIHQVMGTPRILFFKDGNAIEQSIGAVSESMLRSKVELILRKQQLLQTEHLRR